MAGRHAKNPYIKDAKDDKISAEAVEEQREIMEAMDAGLDIVLPDDISKGAKKHWKELMKFYGMVKDNLGVNLVTVLDTNIIKNYCVISDLIDRLYKEIANDASLIKTMETTSSSKTIVRGNESKSRISGSVRKTVNPIIREIRMLEQRQTALSDKLFLNPMSRASLALKAREKKRDELDDFMDGF